MKRAKVNSIAEEIYDVCVTRENKEPFLETGKSCKAFYRRIARWHLGRVQDDTIIVMRKVMYGKTGESLKNWFKEEVLKKCLEEFN